MKIKKTYALVVLLLFSLFFCGCGKKEELSKATKIRFYTRGTTEELRMWEKITQKFMVETPSIEVKIEHSSGYVEYFTKLLTMVAGGTAPDIIFMDSNLVPSYAEKDILLDLMPFIEKDNEVRMEDYYSEGWKLATYKGKIYFFPDNLPVHVVYYNKDMFDEIGLPYPEPDWTWSDFLEKAKSLTRDVNGDGKTDYFGSTYGRPDLWIFQNGGKIVDDPENPTRSAFNSTEVIEALQFMADLRHKYRVVPNLSAYQEQGPRELFMTGRIGMLIDGHWAIQELKKIKDFHWDIAELPKGKRKVTYFNSGGPSIVSQTKHPEAAWQLIKYLCGYEGQNQTVSTGYSVTALKKITQSDIFLSSSEGRNKQAFINSIPYCVIYAQTPVAMRIDHLIWTNVDLLWIGEATAKEVAEKINSEIDRALKSEVE